jgi:hypothetical protein
VTIAVQERGTDRFLTAWSSLSSLWSPFTHESDCYDHRSGGGQKDLAAPDEDRPIATGIGSELRVISNLSPCLLRGDSYVPAAFLLLPKSYITPLEYSV